MGSDDMDRPCRSGLSDGSDLRSGVGQGGTGAPLQHQIHCPPRQGRNISVNCGALWHLGAGLLGYCGTWYLPGDLLYLYLLSICLYHHSTAAQARYRHGAPLARAPTQPMLGPSKNLNLPPSLASHRIASHHTTQHAPILDVRPVVLSMQHKAGPYAV